MPDKQLSLTQLSLTKAGSIFIGFTVYFFVLLHTLLPLIKRTFSLNPALYWFIIGYFLFVPLLIYSIAAVKREGNHNLNTILQALNLRRLSKTDLKYSVGGLLLVFAGTGLIFGASALLTHYFDIRPLSTTPWFMEMQPFQGQERLLLLIWLPMFFFNIVGEEMLWRGYVQTRLKGRHSWIICSFFWLLFHLPFGPDLMIMLIPVIIVIPWVYKITGNASTGIFIHGLFNGPTFVLVALGLLQ